ncbi:MAG: hypothetical protein LBC20_08760, partial [Planctomycetaceae bacterium]|nr:hypothetical protein [Planctomycetaceae bacterium]
MENVMFSIGIVLAVAAVIYAIVTVFFCIMVYWAAFARCKKLPKLILPSKQHLLFCQTDNWAENNGFHYVGIFQVPMASLAVWENPETSSFFVQYLSFNGSYFEFGTLFDNNIYLETGNLLFGLLTYPTLPGFYVQHFPKKSLEEIWELHNESIRYLTEQGNAHLIPFHPDFPWGNIPSTD